MIVYKRTQLIQNILNNILNNLKLYFLQDLTLQIKVYNVPCKTKFYFMRYKYRFIYSIKFEYKILYKKEIIISVLNFMFMVILCEGIYLK